MTTGLGVYTDRQTWISRSFSHSGTCCDTTCQSCGRTYFITSSGHGDYPEGTLDRLRKKAEEKPLEYIEVPDFGSIHTMLDPMTGKQVVIGCLCDPTEYLSEFIETYAEELTGYLEQYWEAKRKNAEYDLSRAVANQEALKRQTCHADE